MTGIRSLPTVGSRIPERGGYLSKVRDDVWGEFLVSVVALLKSAGTRIAANVDGHAYQDRSNWYGPGSYKVLGNRVELPLENSVTDAIERSCNKIRRERRANHLLVRKQIFIVQQQPREDQEALGDSAYRTDLQIASSSLHYLDLRIEAKRILGAGDASDYVGEDGLMRFAHREPYTSKPVGMMLGYTLRGDDDHWHTEIQKRAAKIGVDRFETLRAGRWAIPGSILTSPTCGSVLVLHLLLPFETKPSAREIDRVNSIQIAGATRRVG